MNVGNARGRGRARFIVSLSLSLAATSLHAGLAGAAAAPAPTLVDKARAALAANHPEEALALARKAVAAERTADTLHVAGMAAFRAGRFDEACDMFAAELAARPQGSEPARVAAFNLAGAEYKVGRFPEAGGHFREAAVLPQLAPLATFDAALCAEAAGDTSDAIELQLQALVRATAANQPTIADEAKRSLEELRGVKRTEARALVKQGLAALKTGKAAEAKDLFERALMKARAGNLPDAERADIDYALGHALLEVDAPYEAVRHFQNALAFAPNDPEYLYMLGLALYRTGSLADSAAEIEQSIAAGLPEPDAARAREFLGAIRDGKK